MSACFTSAPCRRRRPASASGCPVWTPPSRSAGPPPARRAGRRAKIIGLATSRCRAAARTAASRRSASRSAATNPGVRSATSSRCTSEASGEDREQHVEQRAPAGPVRQRHRQLVVEPARAGAAPGTTPSGRARGADHRDARPRPPPGATTSSSTVASGLASSRGASASTSSSSSTAGARPVASASASRSAAAAADASSAAIPGAQRRTTVAPTAAATDRTSVVLPDPAGPVTSTPSCGVVPSRASTSVWWKPRSSHSCSCAGLRLQAGQVVQGRRRLVRRLGRAAGGQRREATSGSRCRWWLRRPASRPRCPW